MSQPKPVRDTFLTVRLSRERAALVRRLTGLYARRHKLPAKKARSAMILAALAELSPKYLPQRSNTP